MFTFSCRAFMKPTSTGRSLRGAARVVRGCWVMVGSGGVGAQGEMAVEALVALRGGGWPLASGQSRTRAQTGR